MKENGGLHYMHRILWQPTQSQSIAFALAGVVLVQCPVLLGKEGGNFSWKLWSNFVIQPNCMLLCAATVSKQHTVGSSARIGFDQLTALCLWCSAADLSSRPESRVHLGFSEKMINNNNPLRELNTGRDQRDHWVKKTELLLQVFFSVNLCSLVLVHLNFTLTLAGIADWLLSTTGQEFSRK